MPPTNGQINQKLDQYLLDYCDSSCLISSFYDFYTYTNYTISQATGLLSNINQAWFKQNLQDFPFFRMFLNTQIFYVITYGPDSNGYFFKDF